MQVNSPLHPSLDKVMLFRSTLLYSISSVRLLPAAFKLSSIFMQMNIFSSKSVGFKWKEWHWPEFSRNTVEEPQMEKLHVGLCRNSQRSWHASTQPFASCSLHQRQLWQCFNMYFTIIYTYHSSQRKIQDRLWLQQMKNIHVNVTIKFEKVLADVF